MTKQPLYIIVGQTASGKTNLAVQIARQVGGEIISSDARQVYKHLDIVTGKDIGNAQFNKVEETSNKHTIGYYLVNTVPIWLYDVVEPVRVFSSYDWTEDVLSVLKHIKRNKHVPIIAGGTYFYIKSLFEPPHYKVKPDWEKRKVMDLLSVKELQAKLHQLAPGIFLNLNRSDQNNKRRLIRWIEKSQDVIHSSVTEGDGSLLKNYDPYFIGLCFEDIKVLNERITQRVHHRLQNGAIEEVELLMRMGLTSNDPGLQTIGYQQLFKYLLGEMTHQEMVEEWITKERQYAKRQYTFMKKDQRIKWFYVDKMSLQELVSKIYLIS